MEVTIVPSSKAPSSAMMTKIRDAKNLQQK